MAIRVSMMAIGCFFSKTLSPSDSFVLHLVLQKPSRSSVSAVICSICD